MAKRTLFTGPQELCDSRSIYVPILRPTVLEIATIREDHFGLHCSCIASPTGGRHRRERVNSFLLTQYVTATLTPLYLFQSQTQSAFDDFVSATRRSLSSSLQVIRDINQANGAMIVVGSQYAIRKDREKNIFIVSPIILYGNCSCASSSRCFRPSNIFTTSLIKRHGLTCLVSTSSVRQLRHCCNHP